jgi:hypothetical protein
MALIPGAILLARSPRFRRLTLVVGFGVLANLLTVWFQPHYAAPAAAAFVVAASACALRLSACVPPRRRAGRALAATGLATGAVMLLVGGLAIRSPARPIWVDQRDALLRDLAAAGGRHLVLVRYRAGHNPNREWVYNGADLASERVLWAREMEEPRNRRLRAAFPDRTAWVLEADAAWPRLVPVEGSR